MKGARDKYVQEQTRELIYSMKEVNIPKGVKFSFFFMSAPLLLSTTYLALLTPLVAAGQIEPYVFASLARTCVRLLALNISFIGGVHYGLGAANYETAVTDSEMLASSYQMIYSFIPAALSFSATSFLLFAQPLQLPSVLIGFTGLMITQLLTLQVDLKCVEKELAPKWFLRFRSISFTMYMLMTTVIFLCYYNRMDYIQRRNDKNRIKNLKQVVELEDLDFMQMVGDLKLDYDDTDLREIEKREQVKTKQHEERKENYEIARAKARLCAISKTPLATPIVTCRLGLLYNKEEIIKRLIEKNMPKAFRHIRKLKDVKELQCNIQQDADQEQNLIICPISGNEFNGFHIFFANMKCGHIYSDEAIKELKLTKNCLVCQQEFDKDEDLISLNQSSEQQKSYLRKFDEQVEKESKSKNKKRKQREDDVQEQGEPTKRQKINDNESAEVKAKDLIKNSEAVKSLFSAQYEENKDRDFLCRCVHRGLR